MFSGRAAGLEKPFRKEHAMKSTKLILTAIALAMGLTAAAGYGAETAPTPAPKKEVIYGSQLMTTQERADFRARMRAAKSAEERERIRLEHHKAMQERAQAQGKTLPDMPPAGGAGMGPGGGGMGPGAGGMGPGGGRNR